MLTPNEPQPTPDWVGDTHRCRCDCRCATAAHMLDPHLWHNDRRRSCGCCVGSCRSCAHGVEMPSTWDWDQA